MKLLGILLVCSLFMTIYGHGYLKVPAARNCMWRFGFRNPKNYNDNELYCGGRILMWRQNGGKCGVCGDPYHVKNQPHMDGGRYANGIIAKTYKKGQVINAEVLLTVGHLGFFEFRVGDFSNSKTAGDSTGRLKGQLLKVIDGHHKDDTKFRVTKHGRQLYKMKLVLPPNLTCERCVMQWWYTAGNNPGYKQETFVNCADIKITK